MSMILVDGKDIKTPSAFTWGLQDISDSASGRTLDAAMHKNRIAQKRKLTLSWSFPSKEEAAHILKLFNPEYIKVTYPDAMSGTDETREFYVGDRTSAVKIWTVDHKRYEAISLELTER